MLVGLYLILNNNNNNDNNNLTKIFKSIKMLKQTQLPLKKQLELYPAHDVAVATSLYLNIWIAKLFSCVGCTVMAE